MGSKSRENSSVSITYKFRTEMPQSRGPEKKRENGEKSGQPEHRAVNSQLAKGPGNIWFSRHLNGRENITGSKTGGRSGIRTHGGLAPTAVFKTAALNHSAILP
jgi:hypothetical protein